MAKGPKKVPNKPRYASEEEFRLVLREGTDRSSDEIIRLVKKGQLSDAVGSVLEASFKAQDLAEALANAPKMPAEATPFVEPGSPALVKLVEAAQQLRPHIISVLEQVPPTAAHLAGAQLTAAFKNLPWVLKYRRQLTRKVVFCMFVLTEADLQLKPLTPHEIDALARLVGTRPEGEQFAGDQKTRSQRTEAWRDSIKVARKLISTLSSG